MSLIETGPIFGTFYHFNENVLFEIFQKKSSFEAHNFLEKLKNIFSGNLFFSILNIFRNIN